MGGETMPQSKEQHREYMRQKRAQEKGSQKTKVVNPVLEESVNLCEPYIPSEKLDNPDRETIEKIKKALDPKLLEEIYRIQKWMESHEGWKGTLEKRLVQAYKYKVFNETKRPQIIEEYRIVNGLTVTPDKKPVTPHYFSQGKRIDLKEVPEGYKVLSDGQMWKPGNNGMIDLC